MTPQIYVNPSCSKCRTALSLLEEHGVQADTILYLDEPPTVADLRSAHASCWPSTTPV